jgi:hypothetical protein
VSAFASRDALGGNIVVALLDLMAGVVMLAGPDLGLPTVAVIIGIVLIMRGDCSSPPAGSFVGSIACRRRTRPRASWPKPAADKRR